MATLEEIPLGTVIVSKVGAINLFFRLRWEALRSLLGLVPVVAYYNPGNQTAALGTTNVYAITAQGMYRISFYGRVIVRDGVSSSFQATIGWQDGSVTLAQVGALVNGDLTTSLDKFSITVPCDASSVITLSVTYASNTPNRMNYKPIVTVEQLGSA
jgi:hypothetical protein